MKVLILGDSGGPMTYEGSTGSMEVMHSIEFQQQINIIN